jgi:phospholipase C
MAGQSTRGALNLASGDNHGVLCAPQTAVYGAVPACGAPVASTATAAPGNGTIGTFTNDTDPYWDVCSQGSTAALTAATSATCSPPPASRGDGPGRLALDGNGKCSSSHAMEATTARPASIRRPTSCAFPITSRTQSVPILRVDREPATPAADVPRDGGQTDQAKHLYDLAWFWQAAAAGNLPAVSFLKAPAYQNGHPGNSNPLDEQEFIVRTVNRLQRLPQWKDMAIVLMADDSDGWYDHVMPPIVNKSNTTLDYLCGDTTDGAGARCGYGPRLPLLVISPYARENYVSHALTDQTSVLRFIEDNWLSASA